ncbi:hypothetical protein V1264_008064 [Littorina saxatilis]|uniref:DUF4587 domain-containing protein n=1 Tax=Littorina saxatilis TaxID=31220 RepID=A0AAN9ASC5_9CAEN
MAATDTESMHDNMTRLRMKMVQQKLANERHKLNRPSSESSDNDETNIKLQQAMLRRQELLDRIRNEQLVEVERPRSYSPRRRYTPSPLPPPSRRSLPDLGRAYHFNWYNKQDPQVISVPKADMAQTKHVIEHQFKHADPPSQRPYVLPPIQSVQAPVQTYQAAPQYVQAPQPIHIPAPTPTILQAPPQQIQIAQPQPIIQSMPSFSVLDGGSKKDTMFNKSDFMDMMMLQNAQMHHMVMQQMMLQNLPGGGGGCGGGGGHCKLPTAQVPLAPVMAEARSMPMSYQSPPVVHHYQPMPQMGMGGPPMGRVARRRTNIAPIVVRTDVNKGNRPSSVFLFGIILKEIVAALHRIYLNPSGNIYPVLGDVIGQGAADWTALVGGGGRVADGDRVKMFQVMQYVMENLIYHITEIMPKTGVLGTHKKSAVFEMIKNGKRFPDGYFWQIELDRLQFNNNGRTINVGDNEAFLLMVGMFLSRSLITTLLMKPVDYGLSTEPLTDVAERNLKVLATIMLFLVRRVSTPRDAPMMPMPGEVARYVFSDEEMRNVHLRLRRSYEYCENLLREWGTEYIKRLRQAATASK